MALLAVDTGLRTGLALFGGDGRLVWYRSQHFGSRSALKRGASGIFEAIPELRRIVLEGGGPIAEVWRREAGRRGIASRVIGAEVWREALGAFGDRGRPKREADAIARRVIDWSGAPRPTSLRHDAAEAILIGLWGVIDAGWLEEPPPGMIG
ncbi:hypothetical protein [Tautonia plasticadhaerens]|uniref:Uncharacterized protein n=1 Tax=Tautonia plasticadhaerens TaxID=2527974 RepID=A0A518GZA5_9BACT|nr:hypothetical protein [Tautonia plasticadhaerens]QDV33938.1 hypothetical protein ElP_18190 [Tautonia plasticadhaerens]